MSDMELIEQKPGTVVYLDAKTDAEKADAYRKDLTAALLPVLEILERSRKDGLTIQYNLSPDEFGRFRVPFINITKPL
jgi:hypothetical protein